jgi:hypothetical protein
MPRSKFVRCSRAARQPSLVITSMAGATRALAQLQTGEVTLIKTMQCGRPTLAIRSETEGWEARVAPDLHGMFREFFDSQTASIKNLEFLKCLKQ